MTSYSVMLLVHLSVSLVKWSLAAYHCFVLEGDSKIAVAPSSITIH
jgi:hypothetical protein